MPVEGGFNRKASSLALIFLAFFMEQCNLERQKSLGMAPGWVAAVELQSEIAVDRFITFPNRILRLLQIVL